jgi:RNA polymerase sigma-70 factor (ECF subfamily)
MTEEPRRDIRPGDELALIQKAKRGDNEAFSQLVRIHQKRIYRLAYRFCPDHDTADELAQETFGPKRR